MDAILVVVDQLSKYAHFVALKYLCFAKTVADKFIKEIVKLHGIPRTIVSDCDSIFMSSFWTKLFLPLGHQITDEYSISSEDGRANKSGEQGP